ncbi:hypothetical protein ATCC90586_007609 [Pythium insidiosum]|nr:hypothetical protein ATCC90586_007609 [Pythium insidiosum]
MSTASSMGYVAMALLALQFGLQPILYKEFAAHARYPSVLVIACEVCKLVVAAALLVVSGRAGVVLRSWRWRESLAASGLPACTYAVQNVLVQLSYQHLPPIIFNLVNQTKLLWTALFVFWLLGKRFSLQQCVAMLLLLAAAVLLALAKDPAAKQHGGISVDASFQLGLLPVLVASMLSGFGAATTQRSMQLHQRDATLVTMELSVFGILFLLASMALGGSPGSALSLELLTRARLLAFFDGWDRLTLLPVLANACGGLLVGAVTKYVGGVLKSFALVAGIAFTAFLESYLYGAVLPTDVWVAAALVTVSLVVYSAYPYDERAAQKPKQA